MGLQKETTECTESIKIFAGIAGELRQDRVQIGEAGAQHLDSLKVESRRGVQKTDHAPAPAMGPVGLR